MTREELEAKRDRLIERLDEGAIKINSARTEGRDVSSWEDFWIMLLREYDKVLKELRALPTEPKGEENTCI